LFDIFRLPLMPFCERRFRRCRRFSAAASCLATIRDSATPPPRYFPSTGHYAIASSQIARCRQMMMPTPPFIRQVSPASSRFTTPPPLRALMLRQPPPLITPFYAIFRQIARITPRP